MAPKRRTYTLRETRYICEWLINNYPKARHLYRVYLGEVHPSLRPELLAPEERRMVGVFRRRADAIGILPQKLLLIEASILPDFGDIMKLEGYKRLLPYTEELKGYTHLPVEMIYLTAIKDNFTCELCLEHGIRYEVYRPSWLEEYLATIQLSKRKTSLTYPPKP